MSVLSVLVSHRPEYAVQMFDALRACRGIERYDVRVLASDPTDEMGDLLTTLPVRWHQRVIVLPKGYSPYKRISVSTFEALAAGFRRDDYVIHLEEDCVPAADFLEYFEWARDECGDDRRVWTVNAWRGSDGPVPDPGAVVLEPGFTPWGWATWTDRWQEMRAGWDFEGQWDVRVNEVLRGDRMGVFPLVARTRNIGILGTQPAHEWHAREQATTPVFAVDTSRVPWRPVVPA